MPLKPRLLEIPQFVDDRGYLEAVTNVLTEDEVRQIRRVYGVGNFARGTIRGLHFHTKEVKMFCILKGAARFVLVDPENPKDQYTFVLCEAKPSLLIVPAGYANGWQSLADGTLLLALSTATAEESKVDDKRFDPYQFSDPFGKSLWETKAR